MALTLRLSDDDARRLRERAEADDTSMQDVAVTAFGPTSMDARAQS